MAGQPQRARRGAPRPLDAARLEQLALRYVGRYATTRARLRAYLARKLGERGWSDERPPLVEALIERLAGLGYVDDAAFAEAREAALRRRGYGWRRIVQALAAAGIKAEDCGEADEDAEFASALRFARRKKIGPYALEMADREMREKALASMLRAGHSFEIAKRILATRPEDVPSNEENAVPTRHSPC